MVDLSGQGFLESLRNSRIQREVNRPKKFDPPKFFAGISSEGKYLIEQLGKGVVAADGYLGARSLAKGQAIAVREGRIDERPAPVVAEAPRLETIFNPAVLLRVPDGAGNYTYWVAYKSDRVEIATVPAGAPQGGGGGGGAVVGGVDLNWLNITADYGGNLGPLTPEFANAGRTIQFDEGGNVLGREVALITAPFTIAEETDLRAWFSGDLLLGCLGGNVVTTFIRLALVDASTPPAEGENLVAYAGNNELAALYEVYFDWYANNPANAPNPTTVRLSESTPDQYYEEFPPLEFGIGDPSIYVVAPGNYRLAAGDYRLYLFMSAGNADTEVDEWLVRGGLNISANLPYQLTWAEYTDDYGNGLDPLPYVISPEGLDVTVNAAGTAGAEFSLITDLITITEPTELTFWFDGVLVLGGGPSGAESLISVKVADGGGPSEPSMVDYVFFNQLIEGYDLRFETFGVNSPNPVSLTLNQATVPTAIDYPPVDGLGFGDPFYLQNHTFEHPYLLQPGTYRIELFVRGGYDFWGGGSSDWSINGIFKFRLWPSVAGGRINSESLSWWERNTYGDDPVSFTPSEDGLSLAFAQDYSGSYDADLEINSTSFRTSVDRNLFIWFDGIISATNNWVDLEVFVQETAAPNVPATWEIYWFSSTNASVTLARETAPYSSGGVTFRYGLVITQGPNGSTPPATFAMAAGKNYSIRVRCRASGSSGATFSINGTLHFELEALDPGGEPPDAYLSLGAGRWHAAVIQSDAMFYRSQGDTETATANAPATLTPSTDDWRGAKLAYPPLPTPGQTCVDQYRDNNFANLHNNKLLLIDPAQSVTVGGNTVALSEAILSNAVSGAFTVQAAVDDNGTCTTSPARVAKVRFPKLLTGPLEGVDPSLVEVSAIAITERRQTRR